VRENSFNSGFLESDLLILRRSAELAEQRIRVLLEVNNSIITKLSQDDLLRSVCTALQGVLPFNRSAITLFVPDHIGGYATNSLNNPCGAAAFFKLLIPLFLELLD
jgi:hypothetical protein